MATRISQAHPASAAGITRTRQPDEFVNPAHLNAENLGADIGRIEVDRGFPVVRLTGELDLLTRPALQHLLGSVVAGPAPTVAVDTSAITFIDCAGLHPLLLAAVGLRQRRACLLMLRPSPAVLQLASLTGTREVLGLMYACPPVRT